MVAPIFHLAFPVSDLEKARAFYTNILGCTLGRESDKWIDFNFFGHQIVAHLSPEDCTTLKTNSVDGDHISSRHFGVILKWAEWEKLSMKIKNLDVKFVIEPKIRFKNQNSEQGTFFIKDPSNNVLEFKSFKDDSMVFKNR